jgi:hypothetical protein
VPFPELPDTTSQLSPNNHPIHPAGAEQRGEGYTPAECDWRGSGSSESPGQSSTHWDTLASHVWRVPMAYSAFAVEAGNALCHTCPH